MTFNSIQFAIFLPLVFLFFYLTKDKFKWVVLLFSSFIFYSVFMQPHLIFILLFTIFITFFCGILIFKSQHQTAKISILWSGIILNLLPLIYLKYLAFIILNLNYIFQFFSLDIVLPKISVMNSIGVSFYSFQAISYLIDTYLEKNEPEKNIGYLALYLSFFPKLLQGPIERAENLLPKLKEKYAFNYDNMRSGLLIFTWGLFKKIVVADRLGNFVNNIYNNPTSYQGITLILTTYFFAFQLYCDFSGYMDMAIGVARLFNINLTQNFNNPYSSTSIIDFWRRWHISFSKWLLDYIFTPLQMYFRNLKYFASPLALLITFIICGIWHGASWHFILWGTLNGFYMVFSIFTKNIRVSLVDFFRLNKFPKLHNCIKIIITFHLVCFAWIFFRANNMSDALYITTHIFSGKRELLKHLFDIKYIKHNILFDQNEWEFIIAIFTLVLVEFIQLVQRHGIKLDFLYKRNILIRWIIYYSLILSILLLGVFEKAEFLYFQF